MKIRVDFVTNSSSTSYTVIFHDLPVEALLTSENQNLREFARSAIEQGFEKIKFSEILNLYFKSKIHVAYRASAYLKQIRELKEEIGGFADFNFSSPNNFKDWVVYKHGWMYQNLPKEKVFEIVLNENQYLKKIFEGIEAGETILSFSIDYTDEELKEICHDLVRFKIFSFLGIYNEN